MIWILFCIITIYFSDSFPIEFANSLLKNVYYFFIYVSLPISIIWTIIKIFNIKKPTLFIIAATIFSAFILLIVGFGNTMCGTTAHVLYKNKNESLGTIVQKSYGCGAYDSDYPTYQYFKVVPATMFFNIVTKFDTTNIDTTVWKENIIGSASNATAEEIALEKAALQKAARDKANK